VMVAAVEPVEEEEAVRTRAGKPAKLDKEKKGSQTVPHARKRGGRPAGSHKA
jgi:hypothetical protein